MNQNNMKEEVYWVDSYEIKKKKIRGVVFDSSNYTMGYNAPLDEIFETFEEAEIEVKKRKEERKKQLLEELNEL